jgi:hypothetical protein
MGSAGSLSVAESEGLDGSGMQMASQRSIMLRSSADKDPGARLRTACVFLATGFPVVERGRDRTDTRLFAGGSIRQHALGVGLLDGR